MLWFGFSIAQIFVVKKTFVFTFCAYNSKRTTTIFICMTIQLSTYSAAKAIFRNQNYIIWQLLYFDNNF